MFERYTEKARRVIFFARYESSQFGSPYIETEHLLLGLIREDAALRARLSEDELGSVRKQIESQTPIREKISASIDLPVSVELKQVLVYASEEAKALQHRFIDIGHLVLGLLRLKDCFGATLLQERGVQYEGYREAIRMRGFAQPSSSEQLRSPKERVVERPSAWEWEGKEPTAPSLRPAVAALQGLLDRAIEHLELYLQVYGDQQLKRSAWSRQEALGHLIDVATAHHQWFARALTEPRLTANAYPQEDWVGAQEYQNASWPDMVDCWVSLNRLLVHVLTLIPEDKLQMSCRIGIEEPIPLLTLITRYVARCEDIMVQVLSKL